jgi:hypothetical protein
MRRHTFLAGVIAILLLAAPAPLGATAYTPLAWQTVVEHHANPAFVGQRKHTTWVRDRNRNFIDDEIERRFRPGDRVNVIVDLNRCLTPAQMERLFSRFGKMRYASKLITCLYLNEVPFNDLRALSLMPEVAMVEWQEPLVQELDVASRAVEAHSSAFYAGLSAFDQNLTGVGVNIAILDTGVDDGTGVVEGLGPGKFVAGVDVTDPTDPQDGTRNPTDVQTVGNALGHGTVMAAIAMSSPRPGRVCRGNEPGSNCAGIAAGAGLIDVKRCKKDAMGNLVCDSADTATALDWVGTHAKQFNIRVACLAYSSCGDDDGTSAGAQQANFLAAMGVVPVASYASSGRPCPPAATPNPGDRLTKSPSSASFAISVTGSDDKGTIDRSDDTSWSNFLIGPRSDFNLMTPNWLALKPDLTAPAQNISIHKSGITFINGINGTSPSAAIVSGLAALIIQKFPAITPDAVKDLLQRSADPAHNVPFDATTGVWDSALGWGLANVGNALTLAAQQGTDIRFPNCVTPSPGGVGRPCDLQSGDPFWLNTADITTATAPQAGTPNSIQAMVTNGGGQPATFLVNFGVYVFGAGATEFHHVGSQQLTLNPGQTLPASVPWTPAATDHQCAQVSIQFGLDSDYTNNMTQRNLHVAPSVYNVRVENPLMVPARFEVETRSTRASWQCKVSDPSFSLDPFTDCARDVTVTFNAPAGTPAGERANCHVAVYATPQGGERRLLGGVTVQTYVPGRCRAVGAVVGTGGKPVVGAQVTIGAVAERSEGSTAGQVKTPAVSTTVTTDREGLFSVELTPDVPNVVAIAKPGIGKGEVTLRPACGLGLPVFVLGTTGVSTKAPSVPTPIAPAVAAK